MRKLATIRTVTETRPIEDAEMIELAVVDGWKCVTKKGEYSAGDAVIYCEIDSFLPVREEFEFLRKSSLKSMDEREGFRLRTVKLRGQISQGLLIDPSILGRSSQRLMRNGFRTWLVTTNPIVARSSTFRKRLTALHSRRL